MLLDQFGRALSSSTAGFPLETVNNNWYYWLQGLTGLPFINPDSLRVEDYERMVDTDETVFSGVEFVTLAALARLGEYTHQDGKIEGYVRESLERMQGSFANAVSEILTALWSGFSVTEKLYRYDSGRIWLDGLQTLHPSTVTFDMGRPEDGRMKNRLKSVLQFYMGGTEQIEIPASKCIIYSHRARFGNLYGRSRLKPGYKSWFLKDMALKAWGLTLERYGSPHVVGKVNQGNIQVGGATIDAFTYMAQMLDSLSAKGSLVLPADGSTDVQFQWPTRPFGPDFEAFVAYCNKMMYRALLLPSLIADHGQTGSYSLGQQHFDLFALSLEQLLLELTEVLIEQLIRPLVDVNFGPQDDYGEFAIENFQADDQKLLAEIFQLLVNTGVVDPSRLEDLNHMRLQMGLPELSPEDIEPSEPMMPNAPAEEEPDEELDPEPERFVTSWAGRKRRFLKRRFRRMGAEYRARQRTLDFGA